MDQEIKVTCYLQSSRVLVYGLKMFVFNVDLGTVLSMYRRTTSIKPDRRWTLSGWQVMLSSELCIPCCWKFMEQDSLGHRRLILASMLEARLECPYLGPCRKYEPLNAQLGQLCNNIPSNLTHSFEPTHLCVNSAYMWLQNIGFKPRFHAFARWSMMLTEIGAQIWEKIQLNLDVTQWEDINEFSQLKITATSTFAFLHNMRFCMSAGEEALCSVPDETDRSLMFMNEQQLVSSIKNAKKKKHNT